MAAILMRLVGFHWAFLPAAALELTPGLDLAPTWTAAVFTVTGSGRPTLRALAVLLGLAGLALAAWWALHR